MERHLPYGITQSYPTQVNAPHLTSSIEAGTQFTYLWWMSWPWWLVIYRDGLPVHRQSPIQAETTW